MSGTVATIAFDATIVTPPAGRGAMVVLPDQCATIFGGRTRVPVRATFNGVPYQGSAMPMGGGKFALGVTKAIRVEAKVEIGDTVHVEVERDESERRVDIPDDLRAALHEAGLGERFFSLAYTHQREYVGWVTAARRAETRVRRVEKAVAMIEAGKALS